MAKKHALHNLINALKPMATLWIDQASSSSSSSMDKTYELEVLLLSDGATKEQFDSITGILKGRGLSFTVAKTADLFYKTRIPVDCLSLFEGGGEEKKEVNIRQTLDQDGKELYKMLKYKHSRIDATLVSDGNANSDESGDSKYVKGLFPLKARFALNVEITEPVISSHHGESGHQNRLTRLMNAAGAPYLARLKERFTFLTPKGDYRIDCTKIKTGDTIYLANSAPITYEIEIEAIVPVDPPSMGVEKFIFNLLYKSLSLPLSIVPDNLLCILADDDITTEASSSRHRAIVSSPYARKKGGGSSQAVAQFKMSQCRSIRKPHTGKSIYDAALPSLKAKEKLMI
jgi:hypothetical protein